VSGPTIIFRTNEIFKKLEILSAAARFDKFCSNGREGLSSRLPFKGIYYAWLASGKYIPLLKILLTNICINDCRYCYNRRSNSIPRALLTPEEIAGLVMEFYRKGYIKGLFLSSGILRNPDYTMELMLRTAELLRYRHGFAGYIHLKLLPGASPELVKRAVVLADRVSSNLEFVTEEALKAWAPEKEGEILVQNLRWVRDFLREKGVKGSASTQVIVGAAPESDKTILKRAWYFYQKGLVKRFYYSAYVPLNEEAPAQSPPLERERRLYQADWLLRYYGFSLDEIFSRRENLDLNLDPKLRWALENPSFFPVDIARSDYWELIRVPGIGPASAKKIITARKESYLTEVSLKKMGIPLEKVSPFVTLYGKPLLPFRQLSLF